MKAVVSVWFRLCATCSREQLDSRRAAPKRLEPVAEET
jgi:hypothetical protein